MIDTKELRRLAQAAMTGPDGVSLNWLKLLQDFQKEANPAAINELLDRLEVAEKEANKINGRMVEVKKRLQLIVEDPSNTMSNAKAMREMLRQANLALNALK